MENEITIREAVPFTVEELNDPSDWQLFKLENGFLAEIGEERLDDSKKKRLSGAIDEGRIRFFIAKRGCRAVGMCSTATHFSTYACTNVAVFDDFYIEPAFRGRGAARMLVSAALSWCRKNGVASLTVGCSTGDEGMYRALGFGEKLGTMLACGLTE